MIGYAQRVRFRAGDTEAFRLARALVSRVPFHLDRDGREVRCHELARAVHHHLVALGLGAEVVDGHLCSIQHTWIRLPHWNDSSILDVYTPGRLPQVQLIDDHLWIARGYRPDAEPRSDIRPDVVEDLVRGMSTTPEEAMLSGPGLLHSWLDRPAAAFRAWVRRGDSKEASEIGLVGPIVDEELSP